MIIIEIVLLVAVGVLIFWNLCHGTAIEGLKERELSNESIHAVEKLVQLMNYHGDDALINIVRTIESKRANLWRLMNYLGLEFVDAPAERKIVKKAKEKSDV